MKTKTRRIAILLAVFALIGIFAVTAFAAEEKTSGDYTYVVENEAAVITGYGGEAEKIVIPATIDGYPVREIGQNVFYYCYELESVIISENIEKIGNYAFSGCSELKDITMPDSVKIIGDEAFSETAITKLTVPEGVESIGASAFAGCLKLKTVTVSGKLDKISDYAFSRCGKLKSVKIPDTVKAIGEGAFENCFELAGVKLPSGLKAIGASAFKGCKAIESIVLPEGLTEIGNFAFSDTGLEKASVPASVKTMGDGVFLSSKLKSAVISCRLAKIEESTFESCNYLKSVKLPNTVTEIGQRAFAMCFRLAEINFPAGLKTVGNHAFDDCNALTSIILPRKVASIGERAFYSCGGLKLADTGSATKIGEEAFSDCKELEQVVFGSELKRINRKAFTLPLNAVERIQFCYRGTKAQWKDVVIKNCAYVKDATIHYGYTDAHKLEQKVKKATFKSDGTVNEKCAVCDFKREEIKVSRPDRFALSAQSYTYNNQEKKPSVTVTDVVGNKLKKGDDYTVKYESGRKLPGKYTVTVNLKGKYEGTKKLYFTIAPRATSKITATSTKTTVTLKWSKVTGVDGYRVYKYNSSTKKYEAVKTVTGTSVKITGLKSGTTYKFKVRAYTKDDSTIYGAYSPVKEITTKLSAPSKVSSVGYTKSIKLTWSKSRGADGYRIYYKSGDSWKVLVKSLKGTTYTLKDQKTATKRTLAVRAYKKTKDGTLWSDYKAFSAATKPGKATLTVKSGSPGTATLTWKEVKGANTYRVYYKVNKGDYKLYKTYSKPTKVTLENLNGGATYTFRVKAGIKVTGGASWSDAVAKSVKITYRAPDISKR